MGLKVILKRPSSAVLMLQVPDHMVLYVCVQDKSRLRHRQTSKVSLCVLCHCAKSTHYSHIPTKQNTRSHRNNGQG